MLAIVIGTLLELDPYLFLEETEKEETKAFIQEHDSNSRDFLNGLESRGIIKKRLTDLLDFEYVGVPSTRNQLQFSLDKPASKDTKSLFVTESCIKKVLVDPFDAMIKSFSPSPDGKYVAYALSKNSNDKADLYLIDVEKKETLSEFVPSDFYPMMHSTIVWSPDSKGFWYTKRAPNTPLGEEKLHQKIYYHLIGTDFEQDPLIFGKNLNKDDLPHPIDFKNEKNLLIEVYVGAAKADYYLNDQLIFKNANTSSSGCIHKDQIYIKNENQIFVANLNDPLTWRVLFSKTAHKLEKFILVENSLIIQSLEDATSFINEYDLNGNYLSSITLPCAGLTTEWSVDEHILVFGFSSFFIPHTIYQFDTRTKELTVLKEVKSLFNRDEFVLRQEFFLSNDSIKIPLFVIHKKGITLSQNNPLLLYGYGGFGASILPNFNPYAIPFLEHGGIYVIANIRGGGEFGESWHQAGIKKNKQNVFNDFIRAAEWLIENNYTSSSKLAILGASNGGLLTGAMLTQRPDLFKAVLIGVPVLDMLRYHLFFGGRFWIPEYGSPDDPEALNYLLKYSPYHNVDDDMVYPSTLIFTSDSDDRVHPMHAYKMTARLNAVKHPTKTLLLVEKNAGHGGNPKTSTKIEFYSDIYSFIFNELDIK